MTRFRRRFAGASLAMFMLAGACSRFSGEAPAHMPRLIGQDDRVLFLGDSITYAGGYVDHVEACLLTRYPNLRFELINLGLPSETVSGLSEAGHAGGSFPRPNLHDRLERVLDAVRPDVVFACYGINCGIYQSFSPERFAAYQRGVERLIDAVAARGARVALLTPPPYALPAAERRRLEAKLGTNALTHRPYPGYDDVMGRYGQWILGLAAERADVALAADVRAAIQPFAYACYGKDPVHPNALGHLLWSKAVLEALDAPELVDRAEIQLAGREVLDGQVHHLDVDEGVVQFTWTTRVPLKPPDLPANASQPLRAAALRFNRHRLLVHGLTARRYEFWDGENRLGEVLAADLDKGLDLTDPKAPIHMLGLSSNERADAVLTEVGKRRATDFALLQQIGHKRPMPGKPLSEAKARARAEERRLLLEELRRPMEMRLRLVPLPEEEP